MSRPSDAEINHAINTLSHRTAAGFIQEAQRLQEGGLPATLATSMVMDAALMAAASFLKTSVATGAVGITMPLEELLRVRLGELLALPIRVFPKRPDGTFDPVGHDIH
ncbi:hypothetical protein [Bosea vestrisii]|uniref:Uncharacterized protein n=1 Tax=Bosea vestrisii TaxID=151416 RepID=A0ABW0H9J7_9HYPH